MVVTCEYIKVTLISLMSSIWSLKRNTKRLFDNLIVKESHGSNKVRKIDVNYRPNEINEVESVNKGYSYKSMVIGDSNIPAAFMSPSGSAEYETGTSDQVIKPIA